MYELTNFQTVVLWFENSIKIVTVYRQGKECELLS